MDVRRLVKALAVLAIGIFLGKPIMDAVGSAVVVYVSANGRTSQVEKSAE